MKEKLRLNNRGFAISAILYTMLILVVLLMFLVISIISNRRATLNKLTETVRDKINGEVVGTPAPPVLLYDKIKEGAQDDTGIDFKKASSETNGKGTYVMHSTAASTNPIYYYRGDIHNNFVLFAGFCWQIVRTTDKGGIKLIYVSNGDTCKYDKSSFISTKTKYSAYKNTYKYTSSTVKTTVENWYNSNIKNKPVASKVENTTWCNDTISSSNTRTPNVNNCTTAVTAYVGLPTYDEMILAGGVYAEKGIQRDYWLYIPQNYQISSGKYSSGTTLDNITAVGMTIDKAGSASTVYYVGSNGQIHSWDVTTTYNIRPMIVLKHDVIWLFGTGTLTDPYQIQA